METELVSIFYTFIPKINNELQSENKLPPTRTVLLLRFHCSKQNERKERKKKPRKRGEKRTQQHMCKFRPISETQGRGKDAMCSPASKAAEELGGDARRIFSTQMSISTQPNANKQIESDGEMLRLREVQVFNIRRCPLFLITGGKKRKGI